MTAKTFKRRLAAILMDSGEFAAFDNTDIDFDSLDDTDIVVTGKDDTETFCLTILKIK